ncbi:hypothetical protein TNCV_597191 [Trichonephila clavipes]|nr:hypothetical protein TNCV_597191 [Trichonephila clavipes]
MRGYFEVPLSLHTRTRRVSLSRLNWDLVCKQHLAPIMFAPNLDVQQPIFYGPHGGVGSTGCRLTIGLHSMSPSLHEAAHVRSQFPTRARWRPV